jgi:hypothetical protein
VTALTGPQRATRRIILQKARRHLPKEAPTACKHTVSGSLSLPSPGCFSPFPHGTGPLSVAARIEPWSVVAPASRRVARARRYSGKRPTRGRAVDYAAVTLSGAAFQSASSDASRAWRGKAAPSGLSLQPHDRNGCLLATVVVWAHPGSLATTTGMLSLPRGTEMFQFPRCPPPLAVSVATDGLPHSEIVGSQPARGSPTHIAALPRPSSARSAEASSVCSFCLPCWNARRARRSASVMIKVS